jgi:pyruvate/2-oxoglutarate dehydrogenase complex dihydrolipoamide dehydrogenase (E3) component
MSESFDVVVIGAGQAGVPLAGALAKTGQRVALVERKFLGGSCINFGCTPTKAAIASARVAHLARRGAEFGLRIPTVEVDFAAVIDRARAIVATFRSGMEKAYGGEGQPVLIRAHARLDGRHGERFRVQAGDVELLTGQVVLDTGTRSLIPHLDGLDSVDVIHAGNWLDHRELPERLIIIGGGVIAVEMAQFYRRMGSTVTIIEGQPRIAATEDPDVSELLQSIFEREGIALRLDTHVTRVERRGAELVVHLADGNELAGSDLFVATGRVPNTDDLGLETVGIESTKGIIRVDERLRTTVAGVWAAGDIRGGPMFTHTAWDDYRVFLSQMTGDRSRTTDRIVPYAIFTDPEIGRVGMTETEARQSGRQIKLSRFDIRRNSKAIEAGEEDGFIKVIVDAGTHELLGATVFCHEGAELVHMYVDVMNARKPASVIRDAIHIHPTLAEAIQSAVSEF